ncbi:MAG: class I SAM-dependent methyltransferase [Bryobacterales bacterium]|nr:methyltransferase domain-containing protein [Bryobacteraceae bacterium]MDW8353933.1 class I SAM-dependent methyltransferase [Bryobacterales bacterium]
MPTPPQPLEVKRAEVEFHRFAALGESEKTRAVYAERNRSRSGLIRKHLDWLAPITPFLEIGAGPGHTSYLLVNEFGAEGFALDLSADALRQGAELARHFDWPRSPMKVAGDALRLPFHDGSLRTVFTFQTLSQFLDIEPVIVEVKRVLAPGGVFFFAEEPIRRLLSLQLYRCPYPEWMMPWERKLYAWGLLPYLVRDVIGAAQEESFGIRQNHSMTLKRWHRLLEKHFPSRRYEIFLNEQGAFDGLVRHLAVRLDRHHSIWLAARLLGGTLAAVCRKEGQPPPSWADPRENLARYLRCPDCTGSLSLNGDGSLCCACGYTAPCQEGVYDLLPSADRTELYPGAREDILDFSRPGHENALLEGWGPVEGIGANCYRWIGARATARLIAARPGPCKLRLRGFVAPRAIELHRRMRVEIRANGHRAGRWTLRRPGLFVLEARLPAAPEYIVEILAEPVWTAPPDLRPLTVNIGLLRLL